MRLVALCAALIACDWLRFVLDWPMREMPATRWEYVSGGVIVLGGVVGAATNQRIDLWARDQLFAPLGIEGAFWIRESTQPALTAVRTFGSRPADYGYLWWTLPGGVITASGAMGQRAGFPVQPRLRHGRASWMKYRMYPFRSRMPNWRAP